MEQQSRLVALLDEQHLEQPRGGIFNAQCARALEAAADCCIKDMLKSINPRNELVG